MFPLSILKYFEVPVALRREHINDKNIFLLIACNILLYIIRILGWDFDIFQNI